MLQLTHGEEIPARPLAEFKNTAIVYQVGFADYVTHAGVADTSDKNAVIYEGQKAWALTTGPSAGSTRISLLAWILALAVGCQYMACSRSSGSRR